MVTYHLRAQFGVTQIVRFYGARSARSGTGRCPTSRTATGEQQLVFAEIHIASKYIFHF